MILNGLRSDIFGSVQSRGKTESLYQSLSWQAKPCQVHVHTCTEFVTQNTTEKKQQASTKCEVISVVTYFYLPFSLLVSLLLSACSFTLTNTHCTLYIVHYTSSWPLQFLKKRTWESCIIRIPLCLQSLIVTHKYTTRCQ